MSHITSMLISAAPTSIIAFLSWVATKYEVKKLNSLMEEYQQCQDEEYPKQDIDKIFKKIEKQQMNVSAGRFATLFFISMSIYVIVSFINR